MKKESDLFITLGIIGIILLLIYPAVFQAIQNNFLSNKLRETSIEISSAFQDYLIDNRLKNLDKLFKTNGIEFFTKLDTTKICKDRNSKECLDMNQYYRLNGEKTDITNTDIANSVCAVLKSGASVCLTPFKNVEESGAFLILDITGKKGPNLGGKDFFLCTVNNEGVIKSMYEWNESYVSLMTEYDSYSRISKENWKINY
jgi:hypothetical protein